MNRLMMKLLAQQGIYMNPAEDGGSAGSGPAADPGSEGGEGGDAGAQNQGGEGGDAGEGGEPGGEGDEGDKGDKGDKAKDPGSTMSDKEAALLKDTMKWKGKAKDMESELSDIKKALGDLSPADVQKMIQERQDRERAELEKRGEYDRILEQVRGQHQEALQGKDTELNDLRTQLTQAQAQIEDLTVGQSFRGSEFVREKSTLPPSIAQREFADYFDFKDGQMVPHDKPRGAKDRTPLVDGNGKPKSFEQAIEELYAKHPDSKSLIKASMKPGAGSRSEPGVSGKGGKGDNSVRGLARITQSLTQGQ